MPANVQTLGKFSSQRWYSHPGEDVFNTYGVVQDIGANGGVNSPPKYYEYDMMIRSGNK